MIPRSLGGRSLAGLIALLSGYCADAQSNPVRKIQVFVVAVPDFAIKQYNNDVIKSAFAERCAEVQNFFVAHLGAANVDVHPYCTPELTTREALRFLFQIEIPRRSANTVTLLFVMSHGEIAHLHNQFLSSDLELITSDTHTSDVDNDGANEREFSSILVGSEMLSWLQRAPAGSTILTFIDTCHSGAASNISSSISQFLQQQYGLRTLVMASSLQSDQTYRALFTKALLNLWERDNDCLNQDTLPREIRKLVSADAPVDGTEGIPTIVVRYNGPLCLGNFGKDRRLLFIYAGQDAEQHPYLYKISEDSSSAPRVIIENSSLQYTYLAIPLDAKKYVVSLQRAPDVDKDIHFDLSSDSPAVIWLDQPTSVNEEAKATEILADSLARTGGDEPVVGSLRRKSVLAYRLGGNNADADRLESLSSQKEGLSTISPALRDVVFGSYASVLARVRERGIDLAKAAGQLSIAGDFENAGQLLVLGAKSAKAEEKAGLGLQALVFFNAAGDKAAATSVLGGLGRMADVQVADDFEGNGTLLTVPELRFSDSALVGTVPMRSVVVEHRLTKNDTGLPQ